MIDVKMFFEALRRDGVLGNAVTQNQVDGVRVLIDVCAKHDATLEQAAYILATAHGETGGRMQPIRENMNYSLSRMKQVFSAKRLGPNPAALVGNPQAFANQVYNGMLGNRPGSNDGWIFRGGGLGQTTGRDNYAKGAAKFGMSPEAFAEWNMTLEGGAAYLVRGMLEGWTTGRKLSEFVRPGSVDYVNARRTWNGTFEAARYAAWARRYEGALRAGGYAQSAQTIAVLRPPVRPAAANDAAATAIAVVATSGSAAAAVNTLGIDPITAATVALAFVLVIVVAIKLKGTRK